MLSAVLPAVLRPYRRRGPGAVSSAIGIESTQARSLAEMNGISLPILNEPPIREQSLMESPVHASNKHLGNRRKQLQVRELAGSLGAGGRTRSLLLRRTLLLCVIRFGRRARENSGNIGSGVVHCSVVREAQRRRRGTRYSRWRETGPCERPRDVRQAIGKVQLRIALAVRPGLSAGERRAGDAVCQR